MIHLSKGGKHIVFVIEVLKVNLLVKVDVYHNKKGILIIIIFKVFKGSLIFKGLCKNLTDN